jgi:hypothetical protein
MRRPFMHEIVGRQWSPLAKLAMPPETERPRPGRRKKPGNPSLIQLTTFSLRRHRL